MTVGGSAYADWLGRYIPPDSSVSEQEIKDGKIKNAATDLDAQKVTIDDVVLSAGKVVRDPIFVDPTDPDNNRNLTGSYIRYDYTYAADSGTYTGDFSQAAACAFSFGMTKAIVNDPKVKADKLSFAVTQNAAQHLIYDTRIGTGNLTVAHLKFTLRITLDNGAITLPDLTSFVASSRAFSAEETGYVSFDVASALKDRQYTNAQFDVMMEPVSNESDGNAIGSVFLSDIVLEGSTPEPTSLFLTLLGTVPMVLRRRR